MNTQIGTPSLPATVMQKKKRYEWIDNARIIAAFLIMMHHLPCLGENFNEFSCIYYVKELSRMCFYNGRVPFFLILAGYFLSRNVSWKKAWNRFIWLLIPLVIWNAIYAFGYLHHSFSLVNCWIDLVGVKSIIHWKLGCFFAAEVPAQPAIGPSWFLRDIMFLSLLTPLIVRFVKYIPVVLVIMLGIRACNLPPSSASLLSPSTVCFYLLGVYLVRFSLDDAYRILNRTFLPFFICGILVPAIYVTYEFATGGYGEHDAFDRWYLFSTVWGMGFGALLIAYMGILVEKLLPKLSKRIAPLAPACFMVFMLHYPIFELLRRICPCLLEGNCALLVPLPVFVFICAFFLAIKRYAPFLLPYLAHMRLADATAKKGK